MKPIFNRNLPPPLETFDHIGFITFMAKWIKPERYLELGVRDAICLMPISEYCQQAIGVDIKKQFNESKDNIQFYEESTDDFFKWFNLEVDMVFIDAFHDADQIMKDFMNVWPLVIKNGIVFLHDTYAVEELRVEGYCHNAHLVPDRLKCLPDAEVFTIPINPGLTIVRKL